MGKRVLTPYRRKYLHFKVSEARRRMKIRAVAYKGGKCERCGFAGCPAAFDFHHLDPTQKDFQIGGGHYRSFIKLKPELDKTKLLCANCHRTVHDEESVERIRILKEELEHEAPTSW